MFCFGPDPARFFHQPFKSAADGSRISNRRILTHPVNQCVIAAGEESRPLADTLGAAMCSDGWLWKDEPVDELNNQAAGMCRSLPLQVDRPSAMPVTTIIAHLVIPMKRLAGVGRFA